MAKKYIITKKKVHEDNVLDNMLNGIENADLYFKAIKKVSDNHHDDYDDEDFSMFMIMAMVAPDILTAEENSEFVMSQTNRFIYVLSDITKEIISPAIMKEMRESLEKAIKEETTE